MKPTTAYFGRLALISLKSMTPASPAPTMRTFFLPVRRQARNSFLSRMEKRMVVMRTVAITMSPKKM